MNKYLALLILLYSSYSFSTILEENNTYEVQMCFDTSLAQDDLINCLKSIINNDTAYIKSNSDESNSDESNLDVIKEKCSHINDKIKSLACLANNLNLIQNTLQENN